MQTCNPILWCARAGNVFAENIQTEWLELEVVLNPARFDSNNLVRDGLASATVFESKQYPGIVFAASSEMIKLPDEVQTIDLEGTLFMHGVAKDLVIPVRLEPHNDNVLATGTFAINLSDYNMARPRVGKLFVNDEITITFRIETPLPEGY
jgi:polyisoprenoid-binding protein YceI